MTTPVKFLQETKEELKQVTWPKQEEVIRLTVVILLISALVGFFIGGFDVLLTKILEIVLK